MVQISWVKGTIKSCGKACVRDHTKCRNPCGADQRTARLGRRDADSDRGGERYASWESDTEEEFQKIKEETVHDAAKDMVKMYAASSLRTMVGNLERVVRKLLEEGPQNKKKRTRNRLAYERLGKLIVNFHSVP